MPQGLQVFDASGALKVDISDQLLRFLGTPIIAPPGASGSVTNDGLLTGTPFWMANAYNNGGSSYWPGESLYPPAVSISGNTLSYTIPSFVDDQVIQYGVY